jgi:hypothetical protein
MVVILSTFEVCYAIFVEWQNPNVAHISEIFFFSVYFLDMVLNCFTMRPRNSTGFWGNRIIVNLFRQSKGNSIIRKPVRPALLTTQPAILVAYFTSFWFAIDLIATIPWMWLLPGNSLRSLRLLRLLRMARLTRIAKGVRVFENILRTAELKRLNQELGVINEIGQMFASTIDLPMLQASVLHSMRQLFQITIVSLWMYEPETNELVCQEVTGEKGEALLGQRLAQG